MSCAIFLKAFIISLCVQFGLACNGFQLVHSEIKHCDSTNGQDVIRFEAGSASFSQDCYIIPSGCLNITKKYSTAKARFRIEKKPLLPITGTTDVCSNNPDILGNVIHNLGVPSTCPVEPVKTCEMGKISMEPFKNHLGVMIGDATVQVTIDHDVGQTCIEIKAKIGRKR